MSARATFWAWEQIKLGSSARLILLCLADCHNADNGRCDPSINFIAKKTDLDRKTIPAALKRLEEMDLIAIKQRPGTSADYRLNLDHIWGSPKTGIPKNGSPQNSPQPSPKTGGEGSPKTGHKPISKSKKNLECIYKGIDVSNLPGGVSEQVAKEYLDHRSKLRKPISSRESLERIIQEASRVEEFPSLNMTAEDALKAGIDNGWQGIKISWFTKDLPIEKQKPSTEQQEKVPEWKAKGFDSPEHFEKFNNLVGYKRTLELIPRRDERQEKTYQDNLQRIEELRPKAVC